MRYSAAETDCATRGESGAGSAEDEECEEDEAGRLVEEEEEVAVVDVGVLLLLGLGEDDNEDSDGRGGGDSVGVVKGTVVDVVITRSAAGVFDSDMAAELRAMHWQLFGRAKNAKSWEEDLHRRLR